MLAGRRDLHTDGQGTVIEPIECQLGRATQTLLAILCVWAPADLSAQPPACRSTTVFLVALCDDPDTVCGADEVGRAVLFIAVPTAAVGALIGSLIRTGQ